MKAFSIMHGVGMFLQFFLLGVFLILLAFTFKYVKALAFMIRSVLNASFLADSPFLALKEDIKVIKNTKLR